MNSKENLDQDLSTVTYPIVGVPSDQTPTPPQGPPPQPPQSPQPQYGSIKIK